MTGTRRERGTAVPATRGIFPPLHWSRSDQLFAQPFDDRMPGTAADLAPDAAAWDKSGLLWIIVVWLPDLAAVLWWVKLVGRLEDAGWWSAQVASGVSLIFGTVAIGILRQNCRPAGSQLPFIRSDSSLFHIPGLAQAHPQLREAWVFSPDSGSSCSLAHQAAA